MNRVPIFAHRGASAYALENTLKAFKMAKDIGADGIELDLQISKDGVLFVFHDVSLKRLTGVSKLISDCDAEELLAYPIGTKWQRFFKRYRMLTFMDFLHWANDHQMSLNIELKQTLIQNEEALRQFVRALTMPPNSHFSSFHPELLQIVKEERSDLETALIITRKFDWTSVRDHNYYDAIHAHKKYYKRQYLECCDEAKIGLRFYGINGKEAFIKNPHPAVLGWITDYPNKVKKAQQA